MITGEPVSATMSIALFWWSSAFIYFFFFILLQFFIDNVKPASLDCVNSNIYSYILSLLKLSEHSVLPIRCVV